MKAIKRSGTQTMHIAGEVKIIASASVVGKKEGEGPLGSEFDVVIDDAHWEEATWEKAEMKMQKEAVTRAVSNSGKSLSEMNMIYAGDLINQCICSTFGIRELEIPFYGLFGACSTMAESLALGAMSIDGGFAENVVCGTSSHFASAERQFRLPMEYGGQRPYTAQWTVTGAGMTVLSNEGEGAFITDVTTGLITDKGIKDANNMGAAMAPAAVSTLLAHFNDTSRTPEYYDLIVTGDLGKVGCDIVRELMEVNGYKMGVNYNDCGLMIFNLKEQDVHAGGSGCGCSAVVLCSHILKEMKKGNLQKVLFIGTGALMSPTSIQQGESIPAIAHAVALANVKE